MTRRFMNILVALVLGPCLLTLGALVLGPGPPAAVLLSPRAQAGASTPSEPTRVCGNAALLDGPKRAPAGAVVVPAGDDTRLFASWVIKPDTVYYFETGLHTLGTDEYAQIDPDPGDTFVGAPGAVLSGRGKNESAFDDVAQHVAIEHLTITDFVGPQTQYVVNASGAAHWTMKYDTVEKTTIGGGLNMGAHDVVRYDCLTRNAELGFSSYSTAGNVATVTFSYNEVSYNDGSTAGGGKYTQGGKTSACGCAAGGKFWDAKNVTVTHNYVHNNGSAGIWADTDNRGFDISDNYVSDNWGVGITYEISYNAVIDDNILVRNDIGGGKTTAGFPGSAVYISESGGDSRVPSDYAGRLTIADNVFTDNWGGVVVWEDSNRHCGDGYDGLCTLVTPAIYTIASCEAHLTGSRPTMTPDYYDDCRWKSQNVTVTGNEFNFTPSGVSSKCTAADWCGFNGLFSVMGTTTPWKGSVVPTHLSNHQNDHFEDNVYTGPWHFDGFSQGDGLTWRQWTGGAEVTGGTFGAQDKGSTYDRTASRLTSTPPATSLPAITTTKRTVEFTVGVHASFQFGATGSPRPTFTHTGALPRGVGLSASGRLSGTPSAGTERRYRITVVATNTRGKARKAFTLGVRRGTRSG